MGCEIRDSRYGIVIPVEDPVIGRRPGLKYDSLLQMNIRFW